MATVAAIIAITLLIVWFMPKRLTRKEIYVTWWVVAAIAVFSDLLFGIAPFDLYDFTKNPKPELQSILIEMLMPASFGVIYLNFMPMKTRSFIPYVAGYVLFAIFIEWMTVLSGYLIYKGWNLMFSALYYLLGGLFLRWHLFYIRKSE